jgi:hypothetical protein
MDFCLRPDACKCPEGEDDPAENYPKLPAGLAYLGFADQQQGMAMSVTGEELKCEKKSPGKGGGENNNTGPGGIQIRRLDPNTEQQAPLVGTIRKGSCSFKGRRFSARGSGSGYRFTMRIAGAKPPKPEETYTIPRGSSASYIKVSGPGGPYSSQSGPAGYANGGVVIRKETTRKRRGKRFVTIVYYRISVGMQPLNGSGQIGIALIPGPNGLKC